VTDAGETFDFNTIHFSGGKYSKIIKTIEQVVGKGRVRASTRFPPGGPAWTCVTVDGPERVCLMDSDWTLDDFPVLREAGFQPVQGPSIKTLSIYKSLTISSMSYQATRGDRVVVLVCPKADWEAMTIPWPK
jgi:flagellar biosynthesis/type III secretory pathway M-ring protein FliF/YscJ